MSPARSWTPLGRRTVSHHRILAVREDRYRFEPRGVERDYVVIEAPAWVNVVALTDDDRVVMIRQFRHGVADVTLEIPGGLVDDGESPKAAALRELHEETGFVADDATELGVIWPNPAIQNNALHMFLARGVRRVDGGAPDPFEEIEVETVPLAEVPRLVRSGEIRHALVVAAFGVMGALGKEVDR